MRSRTPRDTGSRDPQPVDKPTPRVRRTRAAAVARPRPASVIANPRSQLATVESPAPARQPRTERELRAMPSFAPGRSDGGESRIERRGMRRHALIARALHQPGIRTVVVQAPAGHGKSTLLEQLRLECEQCGDVTGWLEVSDSDNDIRRFHEHLEVMIASMHAQGADPQRRAGLAVKDGELRSDWLRAQLLSIGRPASIFLDDVHLITAPQTLAFLAQALDRMPDNLRFFIASRTLPEIGLSRLTVTGEAMVIRAADLCFTRDETARYFASVASLELDEQELELIHRQTDGWPASLQLFRLALRQPLLRRDLQRFGEYQREELAAYLAENVLQQQTPDAREFLLLSSAMNRFSAELCDAVLGREDSADQLARLAAAGLFLRRMESDPRWFTYHPLFAAFLVGQLRSQGAARVAALRRRAADWFLEQNLVEDALEHYVAAGDHAAAAATLDQWADHLIPSARLMTVEQWSARISPAEIECRPGLQVKIAWALTFLRRHSRLAPLLETLRSRGMDTGDSNADPRVVLAMALALEDDLRQAEDIIGRVDIAEAEPGSFRAFELGAVCNVRGYVAMSAGDFPEAHRLFSRTRELCGATGASFPWAYCISNTALALIAQGQLHEALTLLRSSMSDRRMVVDESVSQATVAATYIVALYEADELEEAETQFLRFHDLIAHTALHDYLVTAFIAMARIHDARGQHEKALEILDEVESISYANRWPRLGGILNWERVRRELVHGEMERARAIAERAERADDDAQSGSWVRSSEDVHGSTLGRLRLHAYCLDPDEALRAIATALGSARRKGRVHRQIKLLQLAAIAHQRRGTSSRAQQYLDEALRLGAAGGYLRAFLEESAPFEAMLREELAGGGTPAEHPALSRQSAFIDRLTQRLWPDGTMDIDTGGGRAWTEAKGTASFRITEPFTRRERTLLRLLANMASTQEMADAMHLSRDGLKFHLKNIYTKLGVRTRMDAARASQQIEL